MQKSRNLVLAASSISFTAAGALMLFPSHSSTTVLAAAVDVDQTAGRAAPHAVPVALRSLEQRVTSVRVAPGDTLSKLARTYMGSAADWPALYMRNAPPLHSPDVLPVGTLIDIPAPGMVAYWARKYEAWQAVQKATQKPVNPVPVVATAEQAPASADALDGNHYGTPGIADAAVGELWASEGGPVSQERAAECIAWYESGDQIVILSPSDDEGLMQINASNAPTEEMENPQANMAEAVHLYDNDGWSPWTTRENCGL